MGLGIISHGTPPPPTVPFFFNVPTDSKYCGTKVAPKKIENPNLQASKRGIPAEDGGAGASADDSSTFRVYGSGLLLPPTLQGRARIAGWFGEDD